MKEEITNIINKLLKPDNFKYYANYGYAYPLLAIDADTIIEFIEKSEEENKSLQSQLKAKEEENEQLKADYGNLAQVERDFLKEIIKEAREYIRSNNIEVLKYHDIPSETASYEIVTVDLLKILSKGENK